MKRLDFSYGGAGGLFIIPTIEVNEDRGSGISFIFLFWHFTLCLRSKDYLVRRKILAEYGKRFANSRDRNVHVRPKNTTGFDLNKYANEKRNQS